MFLSLKLIPLSPHFASSSVCISMYSVDWLHFPILEDWPYVGDILGDPAAHSLWSAEPYVLGVPLCGLCGPFCCSGADGKVELALGLVGYEALPCSVAAGDGMGFKKIPPWGEKVDRIFVFLEYVSITCLLWTALCPPQIHMLKS